MLATINPKITAGPVERSRYDIATVTTVKKAKATKTYTYLLMWCFTSSGVILSSSQ